MTNADPKRSHTAVLIEVGAWREEIDEAIAPLIEAIWMAGIPTMMSCQETEPGMAWIEFEELDDLQQFLNLVSAYEKGADTMYNRITQELLTSPSATPNWVYQLNPLDCGGDDENDHRSNRGCDIIFSVGVYIPHADLPVVLDRLRRNL